MKDRSNRRDFLGTAAKMAVVAPASLSLPLSAYDSHTLDAWLSEQGIGTLTDRRTDEVVAGDESYWARVRKLYSLQAGVINLDNGWTNPTPEAALAELGRNGRKLEGLPAEHLPGMWEEITTKRVRAALALAMGVPGDELALVRNATEALNTVLLGYKLKPGDEVVCSRHDYYAMLDALEQRRARDRIVLRMIEPPVPAPSMDAIVALYDQAISPRTRLVLLTHPSNLTGQMLPARRIADLAHKRGAEVVVDGAQSLGLLPDPVASLACDYYGASAHKWLGTPVGLGVLWMRKANVEKVWPLLPPMPDEKGLARFEWIGTTPEYINVAAIPALTLHNELGASRKRARLHYLAGVLRASLASAHPGIKFYANASDETTLGLTTFELPGVDSSKFQKEIRKDGFLIQAMTGIRSDARIKGIRVSPNVYTPAEHVHRFVTASARIAKQLRS
jgi:selenocysteine lyase/cysteine desulfurase